jgi:hypothetical protein
MSNQPTLLTLRDEGSESYLDAGPSSRYTILDHSGQEVGWINGKLTPAEVAALGIPIHGVDQ